MAYNNTEIEVKFALDKDDYIRIKNLTHCIATFIRSSKQKDEYYSPVKNSFIKEEYPYRWLGIRKRDEKYILSYKHSYPEGVEAPTYNVEYEIEISDAIAMEKIFEAINIKKIIKVEKERAVYNYKDEFEIVLDNVKDLGYFIEIESKKDHGGIEITRKKTL